jgi:4a-hydroxytetrahydrobiopterin dehydratase
MEAGFDYNSIERSIQFKNHYQVIAFLNALAFISHEQDQHADICYGYNKVSIKLTTHIIKGVSLNDMIMAAKINQLRSA